jgi:predicted ATP-grasp superfamily ATP-dependent carboligase
MDERSMILVTDGASDGHGQSRPSLGAVRTLAAAGYRPAVTVSTPASLAAASRYCARRVVTPDVHTEGYVEAIERELARGPYLAVLPTSDTTLIALGDPGARYIDKQALAPHAAAAGLPFPPTEMFPTGAELLEAADRLEYPVIVKPAVGKPPLRAGGPMDLRVWANRTNALLVQPFLSQPIRTINAVAWDGRLAAVAHQRYLRTWPPEAGMALAAVTTPPDLDLEERAVALMRGYTGIFEIEMCGPYLLDVNARVYGSVTLAAKAGANLPGIYCDLLRGRRMPLIRARPGAFYRWLEADIRYVLAGMRSGRIGVRGAIDLLRPRAGTAHGGPESLTDLGPLMARARYVVQTGGWGHGHAGLLSGR